MVKFDTTDTKKPVIEFEGNTVYVASEILALISSIYHMVNESDHDNAEVFKMAINHGMEVVFLTKDEIKEMEEANKKKLDDMLKTLEKSFAELKALINEDDEKQEENKDIRCADFDSNEQFMDWLHGLKGDD